MISQCNLSSITFFLAFVKFISFVTFETVTVYWKEMRSTLTVKLGYICTYHPKKHDWINDKPNLAAILDANERLEKEILQKLL